MTHASEVMQERKECSFTVMLSQHQLALCNEMWVHFQKL